MAKAKTPTTAAFVSQKGGVGKSTLARLLAVGALHRGRKTLLADFDLDQLTCVEWGALRMRAGLEPEVDARAFKSLKKLRREETQFSKAVETIEDAGFELLAEHWPQRDGFQSDLDSGRAGREARNPYLREIAERMEEALWTRTMKAKPRG